jgi:hypothetical protein
VNLSCLPHSFLKYTTTFGYLLWSQEWTNLSRMALVGLIYLQNAMLHLALPVGFAYGERTERLVWLSKQMRLTQVRFVEKS